MPDAEVVIVADDGTEHVFPPGFDPKRAAAIVRRQRTSAPEQSGMLDSLLSAVGDAGSGIKAGALKTVYGGGDLIRRGLGMNRVIDSPEAQAVMTPPDTTAGKLGFLAEQVGEFALPATKLAKGMKGASVVKQAAAQGGLGGAVSAAQSGGDPLQTAIGTGTGAAGPMVSKAAQSGARAVYRGFLKPSIAAKNAPKANAIVETAIREAIPIARSGASFDKSGRVVGKAGRVIEALRAEVDAEVAQAGGTIDLKRIADRVRRFAKQRYDKAGADPADLKAAMDVADRIDQHASVKGATNVSVSKANEVKKTLQDTARSSFGVPNANAKKTAEKAGARKLRIAVEGATGGRSGPVATLNAREAKLISSAKAIAQAVERDSNTQVLYGAKSLASGALGASGVAAGMGGPAALVGALATRLALQPQVATRAAIVADRLAKELGLTAASAARLAVHVVSEQGEQ